MISKKGTKISKARDAEFWAAYVAAAMLLAAAQRSAVPQEHSRSLGLTILVREIERERGDRETKGG